MAANKDIFMLIQNYIKKVMPRLIYSSVGAHTTFVGFIKPSSKYEKFISHPSQKKFKVKQEEKKNKEKNLH